MNQKLSIEWSSLRFCIGPLNDCPNASDLLFSILFANDITVLIEGHYYSHLFVCPKFGTLRNFMSGYRYVC